MVCNSNSVDCQPGFGAIEILIVSVIVLSFVGIALTILCCLCRQYGGDNSAEPSCHYPEDEVDDNTEKAVTGYGVTGYYDVGDDVCGDGQRQNTIVDDRAILTSVGGKGSSLKNGPVFVSETYNEHGGKKNRDMRTGQWIHLDGDRSERNSQCSLEKYLSPTPTQLTSLSWAETETASFHSSLPRTKYATPPRHLNSEMPARLMRPMSSSCLRYGCYQRPQLVGPTEFYLSTENMLNQRPTSLHLGASRRSLTDVDRSENDTKRERSRSRKRATSRQSVSQLSSDNVASRSAPVTPVETQKSFQNATQTSAHQATPATSRCPTPIESRDLTPFESLDEGSLIGFMEPLHSVSAQPLQKISNNSKQYYQPSSPSGEYPSNISTTRNRGKPISVNVPYSCHARPDKAKQRHNQPEISSRPNLEEKDQSSGYVSNQQTDSSNQDQRSVSGMRKSGSFPSPVARQNQHSRIRHGSQQQQQQQQQQPYNFPSSAPRQHINAPPGFYSSRPQRYSLPGAKSIPSQSKITTTFSADQEEHDETKEMLDGDRTMIERNTPVSAGCRHVSKSVPCRGALKGKEVSSKISQGRRQIDLDLGEAFMRQNEDGEKPAHQIQRGGEWGDDDSSSSSHVELPRRSLSEIELSNEDGNYDIDEVFGNVQTIGPSYDRFDTGFWEDESNISPDCGIDNVHLKGKEGKDLALKRYKTTVETC